MKKFFLFGVLLLLSINVYAKDLIVGTDPQYAPFTFQNENNKNVGFDIDLIEEIAKRLNYKVNYKNMNFDGLIPSILTKNIDLIAGSMVITNERKKKINFTEEYYKAGLSIVVTNKNNNIKSVKDLENNIKVGVHIGTVGAIAAHKINGANVIEYDNMADVWIALITGKVEAIINDHPMNLYYIKTKGNKVKIVGEILEIQYFGFGINKNNKTLLSDFNRVLKEMKQDKTYKKIYEKWF